MAVDVRGLRATVGGKAYALERAQSSFVFDDSGRQLWPDAVLVKNVNSKLVNEGNLQSYLTTDAGLSAFPKVTRVKASRVQATKFSPASNYITDVALDASAAAAFRAAGTACKVVYIKD